MRYCPNCKRDFEDTATECKWCEVELVAELQDEKAQIKEKMRRELMPTEEELETEQTEFFEGNGETEVIYTTFDPIQVAKIEKAIKEAGIPVLVRPTEEEKEETEETQAAEAPAEEPADEDVPEEEDITEEPKKGFFARLFPGKKKEKKVPEEEYVFTRGGMMLDVIVPAALTEEAYAVLNETLGIVGATEDWHYEETVVIHETEAENGAEIFEHSHGDYDEFDHEPEELTHFIDEDHMEEYD